MTRIVEQGINENGTFIKEEVWGHQQDMFQGVPLKMYEHIASNDDGTIECLGFPRIVPIKGMTNLDGSPARIYILPKKQEEIDFQNAMAELDEEFPGLR